MVSTGKEPRCTALLSQTVEFKKKFLGAPAANMLRIFIACPWVNINMQASSVKSIKFINISPLPFTEHAEVCGKAGQPLLKDCCGGVSAIPSSPQEASPHKCLRPSQCAISCVAVRPLLKGAVILPVVPNALYCITTPSLSACEPGRLAYPRLLPNKLQTQIFK